MTVRAAGDTTKPAPTARPEEIENARTEALLAALVAKAVAVVKQRSDNFVIQLKAGKVDPNDTFSTVITEKDLGLNAGSLRLATIEIIEKEIKEKLGYSAYEKRNDTNGDFDHYSIEVFEPTRAKK